MALKEIILIFAFILSVLVLAAEGNARASPPDEEWNQTYEMSGIIRVETFQQTVDPGYILAGNTRPDTRRIYDINRYSNISLIKISLTGSEQWNRSFGGTFSDERVQFVLQTSDGGYLIAGSTNTCGKTCPDDVWLIKINTGGIEQWNLTLGGTGNEEMVFVRQTADDGYFLVGNTDSYGAGSSDIWFVKVDLNGNMQWNNTFGGIGQDKVYSVSQVPGGYIIAGGTESYGAGYFDYWLVKTDTKGEVQWNNTFRGIIWYDSAHPIQQTRDGGYILVGVTGSSNSFDCRLVKTNSEGVEMWSRTFGYDEGIRPYSILQTPDGGYIIAGEIGYEGTDSCDMWLARTDSDGYMQWETNFGGTGHDVAKSVLLASDGGLVVAGDKDTFSEQGTDFWLIKLGGIPAEPEGGDELTDGEPIQTPDIPGFGAVVAVMSLLVWVGLAGWRR